jgi:hypothetical protein
MLSEMRRRYGELRIVRRQERAGSTCLGPAVRLLFQWDSQHTCLHRGGVVARQVAGQALQGTSSAEQSRCRARTGRLGRHRANQAHYCRTRDERLCSRSAWIALQSDARPSDRLCHLTIADVFTLRAGFGMPHGAETKTRHGSGGDCRCSLRAGRRQQRSGHAMATGGSSDRFDACSAAAEAEYEEVRGE